MGLLLGVLPGFGGSVGLALLLPFIFGLEQAQGIALMMGVASVVATSDTFPAVLIGVPGSVSSQATVEDGFPMAKKGQASRALAAGFTASLFGGLFGAIVLTGVIQAARPIVLAFGTGEMLMLGAFGLTMVGLLSGTSLVKGLLSAMLGLCIGMIGLTPASNEYRMEFELLYLSNGIPLMVIAISIFAIPEIIDLMRKNASVSEKAVLADGWLQGVRDVIKHKWLVLRCSVFGTLIGMLPGLGGSVVDWIAYAHAVQSSKDKESFGKGDVRGVVAPESANNAKEGGALVPTLIFGIPGSAATAILLGGLVLLGVQPGIEMVTREVDVVYTIIWSLALANVLGATLCVLLAQPIARLTTINFTLIAPFLIVFVFFAAFQSTDSWGDILVATMIGILAYFLRRYGYPRPALMIGFVLAMGVETNFYQTLQFYGWDLFTRPVFLTLVVITLFSIWGGWRMMHSQKLDEERVLFARTGAQLTMPLFFILAALFVLVTTSGLTFQGRLFPQVIAVPMLVLGLLLIWNVWKAPFGDPVLCDRDAPGGERRPQQRLETQLAWFVVLTLGSFVAGFWAAAGAFVFVFLKVKAQRSWLESAGGGLIILAILTLLAFAFNMEFPRGLFQEWFDLPFPLEN